MTQTTFDMLKDQVNSIVDRLETEGFFSEEELEEMGEEYCTPLDYLQDALDILITANVNGEYRGARVLVTFGGPNIWIDTNMNRVEGYWGGEEYMRSFDDVNYLDESLKEYWECR